MTTQFYSIKRQTILFSQCLFTSTSLLVLISALSIALWEGPHAAMLFDNMTPASMHVSDLTSEQIDSYARVSKGITENQRIADCPSGCLMLLNHRTVQRLLIRYRKYLRLLRRKVQGLLGSRLTDILFPQKQQILPAYIGLVLLLLFFVALCLTFGVFLSCAVVLMIAVGLQRFIHVPSGSYRTQGSLFQHQQQAQQAFMQPTSDLRASPITHETKNAALTLQTQLHELHELVRQLQQDNQALQQKTLEQSAIIKALHRAEFRYKDTFDNATEGIFQWSPQSQLLTANMAFARMMGYNNVNSLLLTFADTPFCFCANSSINDLLVQALENNNSVSNFEIELQQQNGSRLWVNMNARRVTDCAENTLYYEAFINNISFRKNAEEKLKKLAFHDPLTGLANRLLFHDRLRMALCRATRHQHQNFSVLYLDLNKFKVINDTYGHSGGDAVLCHVAMTILSCVRDVDTVARFGGDEFGIIIEYTDIPSRAVQIAKRILAALKTPFILDGTPITIEASIGIVLHAERYEHTDDILHDADMAMYRAKTRKNNSFRVFSKTMRRDNLEQMMVENDLRLAQKNNNFFIQFKPIVNLNTQSIHGAIASLCWKKSSTTLQAEHIFPLAQSSPLTKRIELHFLKQLCQQMRQCLDETGPDFAVHVRVTEKQLASSKFCRFFIYYLEKLNICPTRFRFEVTEQTLLHNGGSCLASIQKLREHGIRFCLDDFGSDLTSLGCIKHISLDCIKINKDLLLAAETDSQSLAILKNILSLCNDLGLTVIGKGVEKTEHVNLLLQSGCVLAQGSYLHPPLSLHEIKSIMKQPSSLANTK